MKVEISLDSAVWPPEQSFFSNDCPITESYITSQSPLVVSSDDNWLQDLEVFRGLCDGLELDLNYEPEFTLEAMTKGVDTPYQSKANEFVDYLDSSAFLSPQSIEAMSPKTLIDDGLESGLNFAAEELNTSAMSILEEILSANSTDADEPLDAELDLQSITEVSKDWQSIDSTSIEVKTTPKRKQAKRKASAPESETKAKTSKRSKSSLTEKRERKRSQNKSAANRYRQKKRVELESIDDLLDKYSKQNEELKTQLQKLQMELKVVLPLAKAAFATDANKGAQLRLLDIRLINDGLID